MSKDDFYTPTDLDALRMENELLAFEVGFLKAEVAESERLKTRLAEAERSAAQLKDRLTESDRSVARLEQAERDLVLFLRRLANSPLGWLFRLWRGFRTLEQRYLYAD